jgi:hypothetical protein
MNTFLKDIFEALAGRRIEWGGFPKLMAQAFGL